MTDTESETAPFTVVIHHNPDCGTSRAVLARIEAAGHVPVLIDYQAAGWTLAQLQGLFAGAALTPQMALRRTHDLAEAMDLLRDDIGDGDLLAAMLEHPILVNRPLVVSPRGIRLCRPPETVDALL